jgi:hypothetical protein
VYQQARENPFARHCVFDLAAAQLVPLGDSEWSGKVPHVFVQKAAWWTTGAKVGEKQEGRMNRPEGCPGEGVACRYGNVWEMAEGSSALNEIPLPVASTWDKIRQSPSGYYGPTMDNQT